MWVNQPSTLQPYHALNGKLVLAHKENETTWQAWFLEGDIISQQFLLSALSPGWPEHLRQKIVE
jgi:hypothetical protein